MAYIFDLFFPFINGHDISEKPNSCKHDIPSTYFPHPDGLIDQRALTECTFKHNKGATLLKACLPHCPGHHFLWILFTCTRGLIIFGSALTNGIMKERRWVARAEQMCFSQICRARETQFQWFALPPTLA